MATPKMREELTPAPVYTGIKGAATILDVHPDTIRKMIYAGQLPSIKVRRAVRIPLEALTMDALTTGDAR